MLLASFSGGVSLPPTLGPGPPALEVLKKCVSTSAKSFSSCMRCISTEPTMPRQPTIPSFFISIPLDLVSSIPLAG